MAPAQKLSARPVHSARRVLAACAVVLLVAVGYLGLLAYEEHQAAERLAELRVSDPAAYLDKIRGRESFADYMQDYAELRGYEAWQSAVPAFIAGRWALYPEKQHAGSRFEPADCNPALLFEDGAIHLLGPTGRRIDVRYRIVGNSVQLRVGAGDIRTIEVNGLERRIRSLSLDVPGLGRRYAYRCG